MKFFFWGNTNGRFGPDQVNRSMIKNLTQSFWYTKCSGKYCGMLESAGKVLFSNVIVISGVSRKGVLLAKLGRCLGKKTVYIMHGCAAYECELNGVPLAPRGAKYEQYLMGNTDLLLPVSERFMHWVRERYPEYADKTGFLYNGIDRELLSECMVTDKQPGSVIAAGGTDRLKGNALLAEAVEAMGGRAHLEVYGNCREKTGTYQHVQYMGTVEHDIFLKKLSKASLFVVNSCFETFSVATIEALCCGCSVLISEAAGITGILELTEMDIIHDPANAEEIRTKIAYLLENPNHARILSALDVEAHSYEKTAERLENICRDLSLK